MEREGLRDRGLDGSSMEGRERKKTTRPGRASAPSTPPTPAPPRHWGLKYYYSPGHARERRLRRGRAAGERERGREERKEEAHGVDDGMEGPLKPIGSRRTRVVAPQATKASRADGGRY